MLASLLALLPLLYVAAALAAVGVLRRRPALPTDPAQTPTVSVVVAARDEAAALPDCLDALLAQDYAGGRFECLMADDGSTDATAAVVAAYAARDARVRLVPVPQTPGPLRGKARALHTAAGQARGELLVFTDADCRPAPGWARALAERFADPAVGVVSGVAVVRHAGLLDRVQALDWLLLLTVAAAASHAGRPITAMGNNMAVRRAAYDAVGGYAAVPFSVTEDYALFQAIRATGAWSVHLLAERDVVTETLPLPTLRDVFRQRRRWARGGLQAAPAQYALYGVVYGAHLALVAGLGLAWPAALPLLALKLAADALVLAAGMRRTGQRGLWRSFLPFELYLFSYVLLLPAALLARPRTEWKGRSY